MEKGLYILLLILSFVSCKVNKNIHQNPVNSNIQGENNSQQQIPNSTQNISNLENQTNLVNTTINTGEQINNINVINNTNENLNKDDNSTEKQTIGKDNKEIIENMNTINQSNETKNNELNEENKEIIKNQQNVSNKNEQKEEKINTNINNSNQIDKNIEKKLLKERIKLNIRKYLLDCHKELKKYIPYPYDYLISFLIGYLFMSLFIFSNSSIQIKTKRLLSDQNVLLINNKIKEISQLQDNFLKKGNNKPNIQSKFDELQYKLNELFQFVNIRNSDTSNENILRENICSLQMEIMKKIDNMIKK